jgi:hypothetical protein
MRPRLLSAFSLLALVLSGCTTTRQNTPAAAPPSTPQLAPAAPTPPVAPVVEPVGTGTIRGSEESSVLLDNFTAFISAVDGQPVAAGRAGWDTPIELRAGRHKLTVEFRRGVFSAKTQLEVRVAANTNYRLKHTTDAQLFGQNSYCDFWIVDLATDQPVTAIKKAAVVKDG